MRKSHLIVLVVLMTAFLVGAQETPKPMAETYSTLADAILALVHDPERRATLGAAGPAVVESRYTVDKMVEGNLAVYRRLLSSTDADPS